MQTRRDQLHAYRFLTKRALAALVTGQPNAVEPPLRRLTVTTISGVMIAILVGAGFALFGYLKPSAGDDWKQAGTVIVDNDNGSRYVYVDGVLHPTLNYTSAVLAASGGSGQNAVSVTHVDGSDLGDTPVGKTIGIAGLPDALPGAGQALSGPFLVCSRQRPATKNLTKVDARVTLSVGDISPEVTALPKRSAVLAQSASAGAATLPTLILGGKRLTISSTIVAEDIRTTAPGTLVVGTAFLETIPAGPDLRAPDIAGFNEPGPTVGTTQAKIGQVVKAEDQDRYYVAVAGGLAQISELEQILISTVRTSDASHRTLPQINTTNSTAQNSGIVALPAALGEQFVGLPSSLPTIDADPVTNGGLCASFTSADQPPDLLVPASAGSPSVTSPEIVESAASSRGQADSVIVQPGHLALIRAASSPTTFLLATTGVAYPLPGPAVAAPLGYSGVAPTAVPLPVLKLIDEGPALDQEQARRVSSR